MLAQLASEQEEATKDVRRIVHSRSSHLQQESDVFTGSLQASEELGLSDALSAFNRHYGDSVDMTTDEVQEKLDVLKSAAESGEACVEVMERKQYSSGRPRTT